MPKNHVMLDLETLSTRKDAAIIQLAATPFDPITGERGEPFCAYIHNPSGFISAQTVAWWMQQTQAAHLGSCVADTTIAETEESVLHDFAHWLKHLYLTNEAACEALWSHGATFDIVVLENTYERVGMTKPWSYKIERDTRTLYAIAPGGMPAIPGGVDEHRQHDAVYDCEVQIAQVVGALRAIRDNLDVVPRGSARGVDVAAPTERSADSFDRREDRDLLGPNMYDTGPAEPAPAPAWERPPVWSAAEGRTEAYANPTQGIPECVDSANPCAFGECDECQVARGEDPVNHADDAPDSFGHTSAHEPGFNPSSQF